MSLTANQVTKLLKLGYKLLYEGHSTYFEEDGKLKFRYNSSKINSSEISESMTKYADRCELIQE